jgi:uncharacterized membrane protein YcaP (DUF421 family)
VDSIVRAVVVYGVLLMVFRIAGKRSLSQITTFDFVLLLIISEAVQPGLADGDNSMTNSLLLVLTLFALDIGLSFLKQKSPLVEKLVDDVPLIIVENGRPLKERMDRARIDESDVLTAARELQGLERMDQIKYAVLERNGGVSIIPQVQQSG